MKAFCWASGVIGFDADDRQPEGTLLIASGPEAKLREKIGVAARHGYDNQTLLVPGIPEADDQRAALAALQKWLREHGPSWRKSGLTPNLRGGR